MMSLSFSERWFFLFQVKKKSPRYLRVAGRFVYALLLGQLFYAEVLLEFGFCAAGFVEQILHDVAFLQE